MRHFMLPAFCVIVLSACASSKDLKLPKALPKNWQEQPSASLTANTAPKPEHIKDRFSQRPASQMTSLWSSSPKSLFGDRRASQLGDILTVEIDIDDEAQLQNTVTTDYSTQKNLEISSFFGIPELVAKVLPAGASLSPAVDLTSGRNLSGQGNISRRERLTLRLAARVNAVLPNGYLSLIGRQEIMVNNELRYLQVSGVIRIADISRLNTITYDKIADAKIFYGGRGQITRTTEEKPGSKFIDKILPF
ncbi:MAG: flagellar basal body L-ring protein FlgH [Robiginitomaculum sp.]|nr:flagellar basal body L-ring protein FlgH [Robiginitomaculum sp.]